jgi:hypothetical protein
MKWTLPATWRSSAESGPKPAWERNGQLRLQTQRRGRLEGLVGPLSPIGKQARRVPSRYTETAASGIT